MAKKKELTYKTAITELEAILELIESDQLEIDLLAEKVEKAFELLTYCKNKLGKTEGELEAIMEAIGNEDA